GAECTGRVDVRQRHVRKTVRQVVGEARISFALREQKDEARKTGGEFVDHPRREDAAIADRQVACGAKHFSQRWKAWEHLRTLVQRISVERVVVSMKESDKEVVALVERVVHAIHEIGPTEESWRSPLISCRVQSIARRAEIVGERIAVEHLLDGGIDADSLGI